MCLPMSNTWKNVETIHTLIPSVTHTLLIWPVADNHLFSL